MEIDKSSSYTEIWYTQLGKTAYMNGSTIKYGYWPAPGGGTAVLNGDIASFYYEHKDWLGNARVSSAVHNHTVSSDQAYAPYGEIYDMFGSTSTEYEMFTGDLQDVLSGMYNTPNRELQGSQQGRWLSPDPAGAGWNQYAYVTNPLNSTDPSGLFCVWDDGSYDSGDDPKTGSASACGDAGGNWFEGAPPDWGLIADWSDQANLDFAERWSLPSSLTLVIQVNAQMDPSGPDANNGTKPNCLGPRIVKGIQGVINVGLGELKTAGAAGVGLLGVAGAPETGGLSLGATFAAGYGVVSSQGQVLSGVGQLYSAISGDFSTGGQIQQVGDIASGPITGVTTLVATGNPETAATFASFESAFTLGAGAVNSEGVSETIANGVDAALSLMGVNEVNCH